MRLFYISSHKLMEICFNNNGQKPAIYYLKETSVISALKEGSTGKDTNKLSLLKTSNSIPNW